MAWWIWIVLGLVLLLGEMLTPGGFYILFFGIGAIIVGILAGFNVVGPVWFQVIVFSCLSLITFWLFRQRLLQSTHHDTPDEVDTLIGETAVITAEIPSRASAKLKCVARHGTPTISANNLWLAVSVVASNGSRD